MKQDSPKEFSLLANIDWKSFVAGTAGGATSTALFHPLDLIKIRWQVYEDASLKLFKSPINKNIEQATAKTPVYRPQYKSLLDTISSVYKTENGFRGLYRGVLINTLASGSSWGMLFEFCHKLSTQHFKSSLTQLGLYFFLYNGLKNYHASKNSKPLSTLNYSVYATLASVTSICITNPLFLIKTRMCLQYANEGAATTHKVVKYKNSLECLTVLVKTDGIFGLYKGIVPGLFGTLNGTIQMVFYEQMKTAWLNRLERKARERGDTQQPKLDTFHFSLFSSTSKIIAVVCTYPFQLVRNRLQDQHQNYKNLRHVIMSTFKNEKFYGFYKGLIPALARVVPAASATFIVYENLLQYLTSIN